MPKNYVQNSMWFSFEHSKFKQHVHILLMHVPRLPHEMHFNSARQLAKHSEITHGKRTTFLFLKCGALCCLFAGARGCRLQGLEDVIGHFQLRPTSKMMEQPQWSPNECMTGLPRLVTWICLNPIIVYLVFPVAKLAELWHCLWTKLFLPHLSRGLNRRGSASPGS